MQQLATRQVEPKVESGRDIEMLSVPRTSPKEAQRPARPLPASAGQTSRLPCSKHDVPFGERTYCLAALPPTPSMKLRRRCRSVSMDYRHGCPKLGTGSRPPETTAEKIRWNARVFSAHFRCRRRVNRPRPEARSQPSATRQKWLLMRNEAGHPVCGTQLPGGANTRIIQLRQP